MSRVHQAVEAPSGYTGAYDWSMVFTTRHGRLVMVEFFLDHDELKRALGLSEDALSLSG